MPIVKVELKEKASDYVVLLRFKNSIDDGIKFQKNMNHFSSDDWDVLLKSSEGDEFEFEFQSSEPLSKGVLEKVSILAVHKL